MPVMVPVVTLESFVQEERLGYLVLGERLRGACCGFGSVV